MHNQKPWIGFKSLMIIIALTQVAAPPTAHALFRYYATPESNCTPVDIRQSYPTPMRDQKDISWCYAHASADLLQYAYQVPFQISAADIAIGYNEIRFGRFIHFFQRLFLDREDTSPPQTGFMKFAMQNTIAEGACPEENLPSDEWTKVYANGKIEKLPIRKAIVDLFALQDQIKMGLYVNEKELPYSYQFKAIPKARLFHMLRKSKTKYLLSNLRGEACAYARQELPWGVNAVRMAIRNRNIFATINHELNQNKPTGLDFFSDVLADVDNVKRKMSSLHTVLIYGRKFDRSSGECQYMIKNSYGTDCSIIDTRLKCEQGYVWLPESIVFKTMTSSVRTSPLRRMMQPHFEPHSSPAPLALQSTP